MPLADSTLKMASPDRAMIIGEAVTHVLLHARMKTGAVGVSNQALFRYVSNAKMTTQSRTLSLETASFFLCYIFPNQELPLVHCRDV